jgi:MFS family permease
MSAAPAGERTIHPSWLALLTARRMLLLSLLLSGVLLHSMNVLITATLLPSIVIDIGGAGLMSWTNTAFVAASIIAATGTSFLTTAIGARRSYCASAAIYCLGSILCGLAPTMSLLICGRFLQGFGSGLLAAIANVLVREVFPQALWPHVIAFLGSIWTVSIVVGPLIGGVFAMNGYWRGAFFAVAAVGLLVCVLTPYVLPRRPAEEDARVPQAPVVRIASICAGIAMISAASLVHQLSTKMVLVVGAFGAFIYMLRMDRSAAEPLFPTDAFSLDSGTGLGLWMTLLISAAYNPILIYVPLFLQILHAVDPLVAGYMVAVASLTWTVVAVAVASLPGEWPGRMIVAGPLAMGLGLFGLGVMIRSAPVAALILPIALIGGGIGACTAFITQRTMANPKLGEENVAASSVATVRLVGLSLGAAFSGLVANASGLAEKLEHASILRAAFWVPVSLIVLTLAAAAIGLRLNRLELRGS